MSVGFNFATYVKATSCTKYGPQGALALAAYLEDYFPAQMSLGICSCRAPFGGTGWSHHAECRAYDCGVPTLVNGRPIVTGGMKVVNLLGPHGARLGIDQIIYNRTVWAQKTPNGVYYSGAHPHYDHAHIGLTRNAGRNLTYATCELVLGQVGPILPPSPFPPHPTPIPTPLPASVKDENDLMWQYLNIDESLVRHAFAKGWVKGNIQYYLDNLAELQKGDQSVVAVGFREDWMGFRRGVSNGMARQ